MKTIASIVVATLTLAAVPASQAKDHCKPQKNHCNNHQIIYSSGHYCAPYLICTKEVCRSYQTRCGYDRHGCLVHYKVLVITYADYFSNGASRSYTRTFRV